MGATEPTQVELQARRDDADESELMRWASQRGQTLSRTVRGVMTCTDALRVLGRLEGVDEAELEALVGAKFEYLCTCQIYAKLKASAKAADQWKAEGIDQLLRQYAPHLKVAYVENFTERLSIHQLLNHQQAGLLCRRHSVDLTHHEVIADRCTSTLLVALHHRTKNERLHR